jgi:hypothetical protein
MCESASYSTEDLTQITRAMSGCVPELTVRSTIGLVVSKNSVVRQIGTGTLVAIADHRFVVTAAHVIRQASEFEATLGVSGTKDGHFISTVGPWLLTTGSAEHPDSHDVALYELTSEQAQRFETTKFVRIVDVAFPRDMTGKFFIVTGFPAMWSTTLDKNDVTMKAKLLQYGTYSFEGLTSGLDDYDQERHFLLEASPSVLLDHTGEQTSFRTRTGHAAFMPADLQGISGCSVWLIGDLQQPVESWSKTTAKLVGIETGVYPRRSAIKVTRWNSITTLLYNAVPQLRPVLEMYARF